MKIMIVHHFGQLGGGTNSCFDICRMLVEDAHDVVVAIPNPSASVVEMARNTKVKLIATPVKAVCLSCHNADSGTAKTIAKFVLSLRHIGYWKQLFQKEQPDLLMLNSSVQGPLVCLARQLGIKTLCFIRETIREKDTSLWQQANKKLLSMADGLAFLTDYDRTSWNISGNGKQTVIPDIVDETRFGLSAELTDGNDNGCNPEEKYLLYLGGLSAEKGALDLLHAFHICAQQNKELHLVILGDTSGANFSKLGILQRLWRRKQKHYHEACKKELATIEHEYGRIRVVGLVKDVSSWYKKASLVIFPVKKVHQARPVYEAGLFYKPILVPDYENFRDNVKNGYNGLLYQKNNVDDMARKILHLIEDDELLRRMGLNNHQMYQEGHTYHVVRKELSEFVNDLLCGSPSDAG